MPSDKFVVSLTDLLIDEPAEKRFDPNQRRDDRGRWTDGDPSDADRNDGDTGLQFTTTEQRNMLLDRLKGKSAEELVEMGEENTRELDEIGKLIERDVGTQFIVGPPKRLGRVKEKLAGGVYDGPHQVSDYSRATFVVDTPEQVDQLLATMTRDRKVYDKGYDLKSKNNYFDRKVYLEHANGGLSEIQLVPRKIAVYKGGDGMPRSKSGLSGIGHKLYEVSRSRNTPRATAERANKIQAKLYGSAIATGAFASIAQELGFTPTG